MIRLVLCIDIRSSTFTNNCCRRWLCCTLSLILYRLQLIDINGISLLLPTTLSCISGGRLLTIDLLIPLAHKLIVPVLLLPQVIWSIIICNQFSTGTIQYGLILLKFLSMAAVLFVWAVLRTLLIVSCKIIFLIFLKASSTTRFFRLLCNKKFIFLTHNT